MPIFGKKKDKGDKGGKDKKKLRDRFMERALQAKLSGAQSTEMLEVEFTEAFSEKKLKVIGSNTSRFGIGRGQFDGVYQLAKELTRKYAKYISGDDDPGDALAGDMIEDFTRLKTLAEQWLKSDEAKWSNKDDTKKDKITQIKEIETRGILKSASITIFQLEHRKELTDPAMQRRVDQLAALRKQMNENNARPADKEAYRSLDAEILNGVCGSSRPSNGTSIVDLIKGADGEVAYAFKSVAGESEMMGTPKGFATVREVMMSRLTETLNEDHGFAFGWPEATMAKVGSEPGALINGVTGVRAGLGELNYEDVPAEALQKIVLCNLAGGQFDMKWEDVRFQREGDTLKPTCMDGGAAMPDPDTATTFMILSGGQPGLPFIENAVGEIYPEAQKKIDPAMVQKLLAIDTAALKAKLLREAQRLQTDYGLDARTLGLDTGVGVSMASIEGIQKILRDNRGDISLADLLRTFHAEVVQQQFVEPKRAAWEQKQLTAFRRLGVTYPGLFKAANEYGPVAKLYETVLHPEQMAKLDKFIQMARDDRLTPMGLLQKYHVPMPVSDIGSAMAAVNGIRKDVLNNLKVYDGLVAKWPGLIVDKSTFATPEDAWAAVVGQKNAIDSLAAIAKDPAQNDGQVLTVVELLERHNYTVPTSGFKDKLAAIKLAIKKPASDQAQTS